MSDYIGKWTEMRERIDAHKEGTVGKAQARTLTEVALTVADTQEFPAVERVVVTPDESSPDKYGKPDTEHTYAQSVAQADKEATASAIIGQPFNGRIWLGERQVWLVGSHILDGGHVLTAYETQEIAAKERRRLARAAETLDTIGRIHTPPKVPLSVQAFAAAKDDPDDARRRRRERNTAMARTDVGA